MTALLTSLWRHLTDRKVACVCCGKHLGYVAREGHTAWACPTCAPHPNDDFIQCPQPVAVGR